MYICAAGCAALSRSYAAVHCRQQSLSPFEAFELFCIVSCRRLTRPGRRITLRCCKLTSRISQSGWHGAHLSELLNVRISTPAAATCCCLMH